MNAVWVIVITNNPDIPEGSLEAVGEARTVADSLAWSLNIIMMGSYSNALSNSIAKQDVDLIYIVDHPLLAHYSTDGFVSALEGLLHEEDNALIMISATPNGSDLAPRLAARLKIPAVTNCIWIKVGSQSEFQLIRTAYQNRIHQVYTFPSKGRLIVTLTPGSIGIAPVHNPRQSRKIAFAPNLDEQHIRTRVVALMPGDPHQIDLREADFIVAGGRGVKNADCWQSLVILADILSAPLGGTRPMLDAGLIQRNRMIGQTGVSIRTRLYLAVGISGATHHMEGVQSEAIIVINSDRYAPICKYATLGVIGDLEMILPLLVSRIRTLKGAVHPENQLGV